MVLQVVDQVAMTALSLRRSIKRLFGCAFSFGLLATSYLTTVFLVEFICEVVDNLADRLNRLLKKKKSETWSLIIHPVYVSCFFNE